MAGERPGRQDSARREARRDRSVNMPWGLRLGASLGGGLLGLVALLAAVPVAPDGTGARPISSWAEGASPALGPRRGAQAAAEALADYYPLAEGQSREYAIREASGQTGRLTETVTGTRFINGVQATRLAISDGTESYVTLDEAGLRIRGELGPDLGFIAYDPPILLSASQFRAGDRWVTRTTATLAAGTLAIEATAEVVGFEDVTVPAGRFPRAARQRLTIRIGPLTSIAEVWLVRGVGEVKGIDGTGRLDELRATSYPTLTLFTDQGVYRVGDSLELSATVTGGFRITDPYLVLRTPEGTFLQLGRRGLTPVGAAGIQSVAPTWPLTAFSGAISRASLDRPGDYAWLGVLTLPGGDVTDARTWVSNVGSAPFRVAGPEG